MIRDGGARRGSGDARRVPSLRWRIVAAVALLLVLTNVVVGVVTVVAYRGYLVGRLDAELATAASRTLGPGDGQPPGSGSSSGSGSGSSSGSGSGSSSGSGSGSSSGSGSGSSSGSGSGSSSGSDRPDPGNAFIGAPGQSADTVVAIFRDDSTVLAGYTDARGQQHRLTPAQERTLAGVATDGQPVTVSLGSLGSYRAEAVGSDGDVFVTALPLGDQRASVVRLVVVIGSVTLAGLLVAVWAGAMLVRRAFRPLEHVAAVATSVTALDLERGDTDIAVRVADTDLASNREVGAVGTALNRLLGHVGRALRVRSDAEAGMRTFVADASHELRTPIATVRAYAELSATSSDVDAIHRNVAGIERAAVRMGDLVEELLLLARLDAAALAAGPTTASRPDRAEPVDLTSIVVEATMDARATAPTHRWTLQVDDEPLVVPGDAGQLHRVVANLLANARTHTPPDTAVVVSLRRTGGPDGTSTVRLVVANDGPPIAADALPTLFDRFTRGAASRSREVGTSGLGLAIVRAVVEAHGGTVRVSSEPGRTAFTVSLPVA